MFLKCVFWIPTAYLLIVCMLGFKQVPFEAKEKTQEWIMLFKDLSSIQPWTQCPAHRSHSKILILLELCKLQKELTADAWYQPLSREPYVTWLQFVWT